MIAKYEDHLLRLAGLEVEPDLVRTDRRLIGVLVVTVIYNIFAWPFTSMIPVIGRDRLHLGPEGVGLLATMDGIGAFMGALLLQNTGVVVITHDGSAYA